MEGGGGASGPTSTSQDTRRGIKERNQRKRDQRQRRADRGGSESGKGQRSDKFWTLVTFVKFLDSSVRFQTVPACFHVRLLHFQLHFLFVPVI